MKFVSSCIVVPLRHGTVEETRVCPREASRADGCSTVLMQEEAGSCMEEADIDSEESANETEVVRPCRRMLPDYGSPSPNKNKKGP